MFRADLEGLGDETYEIDLSFAIKSFDPGQNVRVVQGNHSGESGTVIKHEGIRVLISLD